MEVNECCNIPVCLREGSGYRFGKPPWFTALSAKLQISALGLHMCLHCISLSKTEGVKESELVRATGGKANILIVFLSFT